MARVQLQWIRAVCALACLGAVTTAAPASAAGDGGLEIFPHLQPLVVLMVFFTLLIWPANRLLWRPLLRVLDERRERIAGARALAEKVGAEAQDALANYESAVERARREADAERARVLAKARAEQTQVTAAARGAAETELATARSAVAAAFERARGDLRSAAQELGREVAARVLGRSLS